MRPGIGKAGGRGLSIDLMEQPSEYELSMTSRVTALCSTWSASGIWGRAAGRQLFTETSCVDACSLPTTMTRMSLMVEALSASVSGGTCCGAEPGLIQHRAADEGLVESLDLDL